MARMLTLIIFLTIAETGFAADLIKPFKKYVLTCHEIVTGNDLKISVETISTQFLFDGIADYRRATNRTIVIEYQGTKAISKMDAPVVNNNISLEDLKKVEFLNDDMITADGSEYRYEPTLLVKENQYPVELLRLKAMVPVDQRTPDHLGFTLSHYAINLVLPEFRLQDLGKFQASGYLEYYIEENKVGASITLGLAALECETSVAPF